VTVSEDEASLSNTATVSYRWGQRGCQPRVLQKQRKRERNTLFGCVEPATGVATTMVALRGNTRSFFQFLPSGLPAIPPGARWPWCWTT
jgi:hypothetical protein